MIYVFHGPDRFTIRETVRGLRARLVAEDPMADLNATEMDGARLTVADLQGAADALPFMSERRLVVVTELLIRCQKRGKRGADRALTDALLRYLPNLPPTTRLVLTDGKLSARNAVLKWATAQANEASPGEETVVVRSFQAPKAGAMPGWLARRADAQGGAIESGAAVALADALTRDGEVDLFLASVELEKLLTFAGDRPVRADDVTELVTPVSIESIFRLIDALADRNGPVASTLLHRFLVEGEPPLRVLALIGRQFRMITQTKLMLEAGVPPDAVRAELSVAPFVARKVIGQSRRFSEPVLEAILRRLLDIDTEIKTGRTDPVLALDLFVAGVCRTSA